MPALVGRPASPNLAPDKLPEKTRPRRARDRVFTRYGHTREFSSVV